MTSFRFILLGFGCLLFSVLLGFIASLQYIFPSFLADVLSFRATRPLHVFLAVNWIFSCVAGIMYHYVPLVSGRPLYSSRLATGHFFLVVCTILLAIAGFFTGHFSGREYLEFPPALSLLIVVYWLLFSVNMVGALRPRLASAPVYIWSWCTGLLFFLITIAEAHLWLLPWFNNNLVRDMTVQWKANGSMVGAWNMLIYGTAMYAMEQISGNKMIGRQKVSFAFYFLGLTNLMFNWGHHTYIVPAHPAVKQVAYIISMTELVLLANIIMKWKRGLVAVGTEVECPLSPLFFKAADRWILINLVLAIAISIPWLNQYTHGTQITVAHAMGATIGINTMLLLGSVAFIIEGRIGNSALKRVRWGLRFMNVSLLIFWCALVAAGVVRAIGTYNGAYFGAISQRMLPFLKLFSASGLSLAIGAVIVSVVFVKAIIVNMRSRDATGYR